MKPEVRQFLETKLSALKKEQKEIQRLLTVVIDDGQGDVVEVAAPPQLKRRASRMEDGAAAEAAAVAPKRSASGAGLFVAESSRQSSSLESNGSEYVSTSQQMSRALWDHLQALSAATVTDTDIDAAKKTYEQHCKTYAAEKLSADSQRKALEECYAQPSASYFDSIDSQEKQCVSMRGMLAQLEDAIRGVYRKYHQTDDSSALILPEVSVVIDQVRAEQDAPQSKSAPASLSQS